MTVFESSKTTMSYFDRTSTAIQEKDREKREILDFFSYLCAQPETPKSQQHTWWNNSRLGDAGRFCASPFGKSHPAEKC